MGDAVDFCRRNKIYIVDDRKTAFGKYLRYKGTDFILINPRIDFKMRLWVIFHEIGHYIFHAPATQNFSIQMKRKNDTEVNNFAAVMLMPKSLIRSKTLDELIEDFPLELIVIRKKIYDCENL
jgi:Zn-dependent peptidase ImmA (M78 family)